MVATKRTFGLVLWPVTLLKHSIVYGVPSRSDKVSLNVICTSNILVMVAYKIVSITIDF